MLGINLYGYTIKSSLGSGGMAEVWYAESNLGEPVAIKIMLKKYKDELQVTTRFEIEAKAMRQLNHENIRKVINYGEYQGRPFIIMEYLEGTDLSTLIENGYKPKNENLEKWWQQCLSALEHTHSKGIIHRDIKPSNIFLLNTGDVKLLDFGIAKVKDEISLTRTGQGLGTVMYMSPEQILNPKNVTSATDIYSLGVSFAHLIKGTPLVQNTESIFKVQTQITQGNLDLNGIDGFWLNRIIEATKLVPTERRIGTNSFNFSSKTKILDSDKKEFLNKNQSNENFSENSSRDNKTKYSENNLDYKKAIIIGLISVIILITTFFIYNKYSKNNISVGDIGVLADSTIVREDTVVISNNQYKEKIAMDLPNGKAIKGFKGGFEEQVVNFLKSDSYKSANEDDLKINWFTFDNISFEFGTYNLTMESQSQIENIKTILKAYPDSKIKIGVYTDKVGNDLVNLNDSQKRAVAIKSAIGMSQVISAEGYGEQFAIVSESASGKERETDRKIALRFVK